MPKFVPRQRKHKLQRQEQAKNGGRHGPDGAPQDSNVEHIIPASAAERAEKKRHMKAELTSDKPAMSSQKKKRLDKYIDKKLKKEENLDLLKKLAGSKIDTSLLRTSRQLGVTKLSRRDTLAQALKEDQAGLESERNRNLLYERRPSPEVALSDASTASGGSDDENVEQPATSRTTSSSLQPGSGLKRPLEIDAEGRPVLKKRKRQTTIPLRRPMSPDFEESSWGGFSDQAQSADESDNSNDESASSDRSTESESAIDEDLSDNENDEASRVRRRERSSAFKAWATSQFDEVAGGKPSISVTNAVLKGDLSATAFPNVTPRQFESDPLPQELAISNSDSDRKAFTVSISRQPEIENARNALPVVAEEQRIMEAVHNNATVIICGETGSGKTTQVPQFLYEAGYGTKGGPFPGLIGITQPRRVAAVSMAKRVADELGPEHGHKVAHQIRFESTISEQTSIKFMTDGILMREVSKDFILSKYSVIVIDEAHERSANTDILIGLLSRIVDLRRDMSKENKDIRPLKFIIMSATLRVQDFMDNKSLFRHGPPPLVTVDGRQHPVTVHFARQTKRDYVQQTLQKVSRGHRMLPPGGMLVFLTGQDEILQMSKLLKEVFSQDEEDTILIDPEGANEDEEGDDAEEFAVEDEQSTNKTPRLHVLPLYSQLQVKDQTKVFEKPPEGARLIVLATNVAETSLTIPGIRYVFDCGRAKEKIYDKVSGVEKFEVGWISKASASQRSGRAGRLGPGHCYCMYSSAVYERDFAASTEPEILRMPVDSLVLQLKAMQLHNVVNFPFPAVPDRQDLARAERVLKGLGALTSQGKITALGEQLSAFPLSPRYAKILTLGNNFRCSHFSITMVAALATPNLFVPENQAIGDKQEAVNGGDTAPTHEQKHDIISYGQARHDLSKLSHTSDALRFMYSLHSYLRSKDHAKFCQDMLLQPKAMGEAAQLAEQLTSAMQERWPVELAEASHAHSMPFKDQIAALQRFVAAGFLDQIAILASEAPNPPYLGRSPKRAVDVPYLPLFPIHSDRKRDIDIREMAVFVHPSSLLARVAVKDLPKYIIYDRLQQSNPSAIADAKIPRVRMHPLTPISEQAIVSLAQGTPLIDYGKPLSIIDERVTTTGKTRVCIVQPSLVNGQSAIGWPLPAQKVVQVRDAKGHWVLLDQS